jgi:hypothetical protein
MIQGAVLHCTEISEQNTSMVTFSPRLSHWCEGAMKSGGGGGLPAVSHHAHRSEEQFPIFADAVPGFLTSSCRRISSNKVVALVLSLLKLVSTEKTVPCLVKYHKIK